MYLILNAQACLLFFILTYYYLYFKAPGNFELMTSMMTRIGKLEQQVKFQAKDILEKVRFLLDENKSSYIIIQKRQRGFV